METTILTIESDSQVYYFDLNTKSGRILISWFEKRLKECNNLSEALIWFINTHSDYKVKNIDTNFIK